MFGKIMFWKMKNKTDLSLENPNVEKKSTVFKYQKTVCYFCLTFISLFAIIFCWNNGNNPLLTWKVKDGVYGNYGDFVGGVLGVIVALYSAYLLVRTLDNQITVNQSIEKTNKSVVDTNKKSTYYSNLTIIDNNYHTLYEAYKFSKTNYRFDMPLQLAGSNVQSARVIRGQVTGADAMNRIAEQFTNTPILEKRGYGFRHRVAMCEFEKLYTKYRQEMSVHFRTLYLLTSYLGSLEKVDSEGNPLFKELDRVAYAKCIRGQLSESEMLLLRYNSFTKRGSKMCPYINQFNLIKHLPILSLLEFQKYRVKLSSKEEINAVDTQFIELKKRLKDYIAYSNPTNSWEMSKKYSIKFEINQGKTKVTLVLTRKKNVRYGSFSTPSIDNALNRFDDSLISNLFIDFLKEIFLTSNFYLFNAKDDIGIKVQNLRSDTDADYMDCIVEQQKNYPLIIAFSQSERPDN